MEKLTEQNRAEVEAYISAEPEYNVFVQGDLENYGFESKTVEIFGTRAADGALCALLLRYFNNYCLCMSGTAPVEELAAFLQARGAQYLSGKEADVAALAARMPGWRAWTAWPAARHCRRAFLCGCSGRRMRRQ